MRVLIGCECSGMTRRAFAAAGHTVVSCDLKPADDGAPGIGRTMALPTRMKGKWSADGWHYQGDLFDLLNRSYKWDLVIAHPPCQFLSGSGMHWNNRGRGWENTGLAMAFAERIWASRFEVGAMAIENPVGILSTQSELGRASQYIQPYQFGDDASKKTGLWLHNLPNLVGTCRVPGRWVVHKGKRVERWANQTDAGQNKLGPSDARAALRAVTYPGWARAMTEQWADVARLWGTLS
jgi:site-specific DNA-cytosine methylase